MKQFSPPGGLSLGLQHVRNKLSGRYMAGLEATLVLAGHSPTSLPFLFYWFNYFLVIEIKFVFRAQLKLVILSTEMEESASSH